MLRLTLVGLCLPYRAPLNPLLVLLALEDSFDINAGSHDLVGIELTHLHQLLDLGNGDPRRRRHHRIEIARRLAIEEVAPAVALPCLDQREIGLEGMLQDMRTPVEFPHIFFFADDGAVSGGSKESRDAGPTGADALGKGPLGIELQINLALQHHLFQQLVFANVGANVLLDLAVGQQKAQAEVINAHIVGDSGEVPDVLAHQRLNQVLGDATEPEAPEHDGSPVGNVSNGLIGAGDYLVHPLPFNHKGCASGLKAAINGGRPAIVIRDHVGSIQINKSSL